jgi:O-Antigen ligase
LHFKKISANKKLQGFKLPIGMILLHIPLGLLLYRSSALALIYPTIVFFIGVYWASNKREKIEKVAYVAAYLVGAEVMWRMASSSIFWEFGKYGTAIVMIVSLVQRCYTKIPTLPLLYIAFLLPSCLLTLGNNDLTEARGKISFNLSGPFALFVCCWFFSYVRVNWLELKNILVVLTIPIISIAVTTLFYTVTTPDIQFTNESNHALSGGFGPNQVSSMLGLGSFACIACFLSFKNDFRYLVYFGIFAVFFAAQSVMTFSRGGMYTAMGAALIVAIFQMQNLGKTIKRLIPIIGLGFLFLVFIFPFMNAFTGGKLLERFEDKGTTNRTEIIGSDFLMFSQNPIFGTGVGESKDIRQKLLGFESASHTEFSRIISEHGSLGILALIALAGATVYNMKRQKLGFAKALVAGAIAWSGLFMLNAGMRLAAPAFLLGLSFITVSVPRTRKTARKFQRKAVQKAHSWELSDLEKQNGQDSK